MFIFMPASVWGLGSYSRLCVKFAMLISTDNIFDAYTPRWHWVAFIAKGIIQQKLMWVKGGTSPWVPNEGISGQAVIFCHSFFVATISC
jgi:hypothetical protein